MKINAKVLRTIDLLILFAIAYFLVISDGSRESIQIYTLTMACLVVIIQLAIIIVTPKEQRKKRFLYTGMQILFFVHLIIFYIVVLNSMRADFGTWSSILRAHLVFTMATKERTALAKHIRREGSEHGQ